MFDTTLKDALKEKIESKSFTAADLPAFFEIFSQLGNHNEDIQEEVDGWDRAIEFEMTGLGTHWIAIEDGHFSTGAGPHPNTKLKLIFSAEKAAMILSGQADPEAALAAGELKLEGDLLDGIKLAEIIELVLEEIEY